MRLNIRLITRAFGALAIVAGAFVFIGQGCGESFKTSTNMGSALNTGSCTSNGKTIIDKDFDVVPGQQTVSILYGQQLLDSFVSCTGIGTPSQRAMDEWTKRSQTLSEYGNLIDVSAGLMMSVAAVAAETCRDLIDREMPLPAGSRAIFRNVNLSAGGLSQTEALDAANMMALSCWQRPTTAEEQMLITEAVSQLNTNSQNGALGLCTAMLASLASIVQ